MASAGWPDLAILELLVAVQDHGSIGAAAEAVGMDQPNASRALRRYERRLGLPLLLRSTRGTQLTNEAGQLVAAGRDILAAAERMTERVGTLRAARAGRVRVAASQTIAEYLLPRWLADYGQQPGAAQVEVTVANSVQVRALVLGDDADLGFVETTSLGKGLQAQKVATDHLVVVVAPSHPWARRRTPLTATELAATPLVVREEGSGTRDSFEDACTRAGLHLGEPLHALASNAAVRTSAMSGVAPAVLSELTVGEALASQRLVSVPVEGLTLNRPLRAVWRKGSLPGGAAADLLRACDRR
ncbi:MAG: LysR family transcriptional regulator [Ornithinimicrobium sp.]|uniref:LysR family transcriptional regulator n=1 Tax=Ornithinimicrobium sp. TaxID=1977084 RepID=UPI0026E09FAB|nr:LysR family transcriptional regulator [Ornithinimicrobium sp.]MDO5738624.1 LysR family transcriptional regulator [Ornithinimicrobium sp.]